MYKNQNGHFNAPYDTVLVNCVIHAETVLFIGCSLMYR